MRIRLSPKGDISYNIKQIFNHVSKERFSQAEASLTLLRANITQYYISRDMPIETISSHLNKLQTYLNATPRNIVFKQQTIYNRLKEVISSLNNGEKKPSNKYEHLLQIYEDIQNDVEQFAKSKRYEDAESIRGDFTEIRNLEEEFQTDKAEYKLYQDIVRQIGLCNGTIIRLSFEKLSGSDAKKMYATFENLYPKIELLVASKKFREEPKEEEEEMSDAKIKEIRDLSEHQKMNAEQIAEHTGASPSDIESVLFGEENENGN